MKKDLLHRLFDYYHIDEIEYQDLIKDVDISNFAAGHEFKDIDKAVDLLNEVIKNNGKIFVYGDYDADGIMSTSIIVKMLLYKNVKAEYYIPNRYQDGYGLTLKKAQECIDNHVDLVITVDNGVSAIEQIKLLKDYGIKVLVLDHHTIQDEIPNADYIIHPQYSGFGETPASAGFVTFMFSMKFLGYYDKYLANLASISLISDMMPLKEYNRNLLRLTFSNYKDGEFFTIDALKENEPFNETSIGMKIAPKINAIGRMIDSNEINNLVKYFTDSDRGELLHYIEWINSINEERKIISKETADSLREFDKNESAIVYISDVKEGLLGLIANNLVGKYQIPTIVLTPDHTKTTYKGSCRAPEGFNVVQAFESLSEYLIMFGGHASAGGCSIEQSKLHDFEIAFKEYAKKHPPVPVVKEYLEFGITEVNKESYKLINTFAPFGEAHKAPLLKINHIYVPSLTFSRSGEHIITTIGFNSKMTGFGISKSMLDNINYIDAVGNLRINSYRGNDTIEFLINEFEESH